MFGIDEQKVISFTDDGEPPGSGAVFASRADLTAVADAKQWSKADVTAVYNANAGRFGETPAKMLRNRPYGLDRIWELAQQLNGRANGAVPAEPKAAKPKAAKLAKPKRDRKPKGESSGRTSKRDEVLRLLRQPDGVSGLELQKSMGWLPHTVRGYLSTLASKHGVKIEAAKDEVRGRVYKAV